MKMTFNGRTYEIRQTGEGFTAHWNGYSALAATAQRAVEICNEMINEDEPD